MIITVKQGEPADIRGVASRARIRDIAADTITGAAMAADIVEPGSLRGREFAFRDARWKVIDWRADGSALSFTARKI